MSIGQAYQNVMILLGEVSNQKKPRKAGDDETTESMWAKSTQAECIVLLADCHEASFRPPETDGTT